MFVSLWANGSQLMLTYVNTIVKVTETIMCAHGNSNPSVSSSLYIFLTHILLLFILGDLFSLSQGSKTNEV